MKRICNWLNTDPNEGHDYPGFNSYPPIVGILFIFLTVILPVIIIAWAILH